MDRQALQKIFEERGAALVLYARQWTTNPEDALQEAMIDLANQTPPPNDPIAWLFRVVRNKAINAARAEARRSKHQALAAELREDWFVAPPDMELDRQELQSALAELPSLEREIVVARIWGEMSFEQISNLVDRPISTLFRHYQSALATLARRLSASTEKPR